MDVQHTMPRTPGEAAAVRKVEMAAPGMDPPEGGTSAVEAMVEKEGRREGQEDVMAVALAVE
jgi:hypothetical protein